MRSTGTTTGAATFRRDATSVLRPISGWLYDDFLPYVQLHSRQHSAAGRRSKCQMSLFDHEALRSQIAARAGSVSLNELAPMLVARSLQGEESELTADGAVSVRTGAFTGRSPKDKFIVRDGLTEHSVWWDNSGAMSPAQFDVLLADAVAAMGGHSVFRQDLLAGADPRHQYGVTVLTPSAWPALFIRNLSIRPGELAEAGSNPT